MAGGAVRAGVLRAATRGSVLARWQTEHVAERLRAVDLSIEVEAVIVHTAGDRRLDVPIWEMGGKGVFVKEVQAAVLDGRADIAVHSAKDLPAVSTPGLVIAAVPPRADPRDALVGAALAALPPGARVATGSVRRRAQLADLRPDLTFSGLRGNMQTRLAAVGGGGDVDAIVVAAAALDRLGEEARIAERFPVTVLVPQVGQGALAVECRADDDEVRALLASIEHAPSRVAVDSERAFLAALGGDCNLPAGAYARRDGDDGSTRIDAVLASLDGHIVMRQHASGLDPVALARALAERLLTAAPAFW